MSTRTMTTFACTLGLAGLLALAGCHGPGGAAIPYTGGTQTYESTAFSPKTVRIVDTRTNETIFVMDVPVGQWLTIDFVEGEGDDPDVTPDELRYQVWEAGSITGSLRNSISVPPYRSLKVEVDIRSGPEYAPRMSSAG